MSGAPLSTEALAPGMRVGLFGGSFDPVHEGHIHVAETAMKRLGLHRVWWIVSPQNPLKSHAPGDHARRMAAIRERVPGPFMVISDIEARLGINRTSELVEHLTARQPRVDFVWIMGADSLGGFHRWHRFDRIAQSIPLCVVSRPQDDLRARLSPAARRYAHRRLPQSQARALPGAAPPRWTYLTAPLHPHASSVLRARNS